MGFETALVIANQGQDFIDVQNKYGVNALMVFAQVVLESGYGTSNYAKKNLTYLDET